MKEKTKNQIKKVFGFLKIKNDDDETIKNIKNKFGQKLRVFSYGIIKFFVDSLYCHASPGTLETIIKILDNLPKNKKLLNLGGGVGQVSDIFRELGFDVYNLDIEITKDERNKKNINFDLNSQKTLPFPSEYFDVVVCQEIIEHLENPWKLFRDAKSVLSSNGFFILSTPNVLSLVSRLKFLITGFFKWFTPNCFSYHINPLFDWEIKLIAEKNGFELTYLKGSGDYFFKRNKIISDKKIIRNNECLVYLFKLRN